MRVISGKAKGMKLTAPEGEATRPTLDNVREAIFGSVQFDISGAKCLDLFAGSGAMGIEALSRGAESCVFIDNSKDSIKTVNDNLSHTKLNGIVKCMSFDKALATLSESFDFIFMDPPYASGYYDIAAELILKYSLLTDGGKIIAEHDGSLKALSGYEALKTKKYGKAYVTWFIKENNTH